MAAHKTDDTEEVKGLSHKKGQRFRSRKAPWIPMKFQPRFWEHSDRRISVIKLIRKRVELLKEHCGGDESAQRDLLCQRLAFISVVLESHEVRCAENGDLDSLGAYVQSLNCMVGLVRLLGLDKRIKTVTNLRSYLEEKNGTR